jgi:hypothetical protein
MASSLSRAARISAVVAAAASGLLAACGSTAPPGSAAATRTVTVQAGATGTTPASSPAPTVSPVVQTGPPGCQATGLSAKLGGSQGAAGTSYQVIVLTNTGSASCTLYGYPGVSFVTGLGGRQIGRPATKNPLVARSLITLTPGGMANVLLAVHDAGAYGCKIVAVHWLKIYPPGDFTSIYMNYDTQACAGRSIMTVTAVRPGAGTA